MDPVAGCLQVAKALLGEGGDEEIAPAALALIVEIVGAATGSVLVREGDAWIEALRAGDAPPRSGVRRRDALVAEAVAARRPVQGFAAAGADVALAAPFLGAEGALAVAYLEGPPGAFPE